MRKNKHLTPRIKIDEESIAACLADKGNVRTINFNLGTFVTVARIEEDMRKKKMDIYFSVFMHLHYYGDDASLLTELKSAKED